MPTVQWGQLSRPASIDFQRDRCLSGGRRLKHSQELTCQVSVEESSQSECCDDGWKGVKSYLKEVDPDKNCEDDLISLLADTPVLLRNPRSV